MGKASELPNVWLLIPRLPNFPLLSAHPLRQRSSKASCGLRGASADSTRRYCCRGVRHLLILFLLLARATQAFATTVVALAMALTHGDAINNPTCARGEENPSRLYSAEHNARPEPAGIFPKPRNDGALRWLSPCSMQEQAFAACEEDENRELWSALFCVP